MNDWDKRRENRRQLPVTYGVTARPARIATPMSTRVATIRSSKLFSQSVRGVVLCAAFIGIGGAVSAAPKQSVLLGTATSALFIWLYSRRMLFPWDAFASTLAGVTILGYGVVNVGFLPGLPIPLTDVVIVALGLYAFMTLRMGRSLRLPLFFGLIYFLIATGRLIIDYPVWGTYALRDYSLAVELIALPLGYWTMQYFGLARWTRLIATVSVLYLAYSALYPVRELMAAVGPTVGLQQPVPLLGWYSGAGIATAFFGLWILRPFGKTSFVLAALCVPLIVIGQSRGELIAIPLITTFVLLASRRAGSRLRQAAAVVSVLAAIGLTLTFAAAPEGRLGPTTVSGVGSQLQTLRGGPGLGAGSYAARRDWLADVIARVNAEPYGWLVGLGLGPDLASGFRAGGAAFVRKPHDDYLEAYARLGILGLTSLGLLLFSALALVIRAARVTAGSSGDFLWCVVAISLMYMLIAAAQPLLAYGYGTIPLFGILGAGLALVDREQRHAR